MELQVPWNAPEAYVNLDSDGVYELQTVPDVLGLHSRWPGAAVVRVLLGRDDRSACALVPDLRVNDLGFLELVDMGDMAEPDVSVADLSVLQLQWPVPIMDSLSWLQREHEHLRIESKKHYQTLGRLRARSAGNGLR